MIQVVLEDVGVVLELPFIPGAGNLQKCLERFEALKKAHPAKMSGVIVLGSQCYRSFYRPTNKEERLP